MEGRSSDISALQFENGAEKQPVKKAFPSALTASSRQEGRSTEKCFVIVVVSIVDYPMADDDDMDFTNNSAARINERVREAFSERVAESYRPQLIEHQDILAWKISLGEIDTRDFSDDGRLKVRELTAQLESAADDFKTKMDVGLQIAVGAVFTGSDDAYSFFMDVLSLANHALIMGCDKSVIVKFDGTERMFESFIAEIREKSRLEKLFFNYVVALRFDKAFDIMKELIDIEGGLAETELALKTIISQRLSWMLHVLGPPSQVKNGAALIKNIRNLIDKLSGAADPEDAKNRVRTVFERLSEAYPGPESFSNVKIEQIMSFIKENYADSNLSAVSICDQFGISIAYLSRVFKKLAGIRMIDFIHITRIENIKLLLLETNLSIGKISQMCGYCNEWTMVQAFKRYERITPSEYRNSRT